MLTDVADQHDLGVGRDVLLEDWALLLPTKGLVVPGTIQGLGRRQVTQVKPALGTHCHHQVLGEMRQGRGLVVRARESGVGQGKPGAPGLLTFPLLHTSPTPTQVSCKRKRGTWGTRQGTPVLPDLLATLSFAESMCTWPAPRGCANPVTVLWVPCTR